MATVVTFQDWVFWITGAVLALAGILLGAWALFWDRSRGRKRCPKCWYDMSGALATDKDGREVYTCPECGAAASGLTALRRTRRRWPAVAAALSLLLVGGSGCGYWALKDGRWARLIPDWCFVRIVDSAMLQGPGWPASRRPTVFEAELSRRSTWEYGLSASAWKVLLRRARVIEPSRVPWPIDVPCRVNITLPWWSLETELEVRPRLLDAAVVRAGGPTAYFGRGALPNTQSAKDYNQVVGRLSPGQNEIEFDLVLKLPRWLRSGNTSTRGEPVAVEVPGYTLPIETRENMNQVMRSADSPATTEVLRRSLRLHPFTIVRHNIDATIGVTKKVGIAFDTADSAWPADLAVGIRIELLKDDEVVAGALVWDWTNWPEPNSIDMQEYLEGDIPRLLAADYHTEKWKVRVRGDPGCALFIGRPWYWASEFEIPMTEVRGFREFDRFRNSD